MCICCCPTRLSLLVYMIIISAIAFIYGIIAMANFGSSTEIYKYLIDRIEEMEPYKGQYSSNNNNYYYSYSNYSYPYYKSKTKNLNNRRISSYDPYYRSSQIDYDTAKLLLDEASKNAIDSLTPADLNERNYGLVKGLKAIECSIGVFLFVFPLIFLGISILFLIYVCGNKEYTVLATKTYSIFNIIKIICITISSIFVFLSVLYAALLLITLIQYLALVGVSDSCSLGIIIGMIFGYYGLYYYITMACAFSAERNKFVLVGNADIPGPDAKYDINGNQIIRQVIVQAPAQIYAQVPNNYLYTQAQINQQQNYIPNQNYNYMAQNNMITIPNNRENDKQITEQRNFVNAKNKPEDQNENPPTNEKS